MIKIRALGCDISHWQGEVDFVKMKKSGISFVYIKASENIGLGEEFKEQWQAAKEAGLLRGAYHFYSLRLMASSAKEQASFFSDLLTDDPGELRPVLDFENPGNSDYPDLPGHSECERIVRQFPERVEGSLGIWPMLYLNLDGVNRLTPLTSQLASMDLWIAWYSWNIGNPVSKPRYGAWPDWRFWQYNTKADGLAYGMLEKGSIDLDVFNGTEYDLYAYASALKRSKKFYRL